MCAAFYISNFKTQVSITDNFFLETIHDTQFPYVIEFKIIQRKKKELFLLNEKSNEYYGGRYSHLHFFKGKITLNGVKVYYFAFYFSSYDKKNLLEVKSPREKEIGKYTWCVKHEIGDTTKTVDQLAELAKQIKDAYIEKKRQKIRRESLQFFQKKFKLPTIAFPKNKVFNYATKYQDVLDSGKNKGAFIGKVIREDEDLTSKYNLRIFSLLAFYFNSSNDNYDSVTVSMKFLKHFCKADMSKIGIVSITNNNNLKIPGIEPYIPDFLKYGIDENNILVRTDVEDAIEKGEGDGYWAFPNFPNIKGSTFSIHVQLKDSADIKNYKNREEWLEVAECGIGYNDSGIGLDRIEFIFYGLPFPSNT